MRTGGTSDQNFKSYVITTKEIINSIKNNGLKMNYFRIILRAFVKIKELYFFDQEKLNKSFQLFKFNFQRSYYDKKTFKILKSIKSFDLKKNFILSGMNLAFLGYYSKKVIFPQKDLYHWPDGIFTKKIINIQKVPGREILKNIKITKDIKAIKIIGNISSKSISNNKVN